MPQLSSNLGVVDYDAKQGTRQPGIVYAEPGAILKPGDYYFTTGEYGCLNRWRIQEGTIGIYHGDEELQVSVIRDDCQAARRAIRAAAK